ncbi:hypothetical protein EMIT0P2_10970 [Pseudomonas sp. IT-P2]
MTLKTPFQYSMTPAYKPLQITSCPSLISFYR